MAAPGRYDPPPIYRGCAWEPITLNWKDANGDPVDLTTLTPYAEMSNGTNLNPQVINPTAGTTVMKMSKEQTAVLKLGTFKYDWIWWNLPPIGDKFPPSIYGEIEVLEPKTSHFFPPPPIPQ